MVVSSALFYLRKMSRYLFFCAFADDIMLCVRILSTVYYGTYSTSCARPDTQRRPAQSDRVWTGARPLYSLPYGIRCVRYQYGIGTVARTNRQLHTVSKHVDTGVVFNAPKCSLYVRVPYTRRSNACFRLRDPQNHPIKTTVRNFGVTPLFYFYEYFLILLLICTAYAFLI